MQKLFICVLILLSFTSVSRACLWNIDSTTFESLQRPELDETLFGHFRRHSPAMWEWRVRDRESRLVDEPDNLDLLDDLAVAYEKTGQVKQAIALLEPIVAKHPQRYTSLANLGTFYVHSGQLDLGEEFIQKAILVNPDAHFGREVVQLLLVQYVRSKQVNGETTLPLGTAGDDFSTFIHDQPASADGSTIRLYDVIEGLAGMMRFGNDNSPILLEAMGDINRERKDHRIAALAYRRAADEAETQSAKNLYLALVNTEVSQLPDMSTDELESAYEEHLVVANEYQLAIAKFQQHDIAAFESGETPKTPDEAFFERLEDEPTFSGTVETVVRNPKPESIQRGRSTNVGAYLTLGLAVIASIAFGVWSHLKSRSLE